MSTFFVIDDGPAVRLKAGGFESQFAADQAVKEAFEHGTFYEQQTVRILKVAGAATYKPMTTRTVVFREEK